MTAETINTIALRPAAKPPATPVLGVVVPVYNRRSILLETLPHVLAQTRRPDRLVVVDDGSTDDTADAAEAFLEKAQPEFPWRVLRRPHTTAATARVAGFQSLGRTDLVAFLDSDDHWPEDFLARTEAAMVADDKAVAATCDKRYTDLEGAVHGLADCRPMARDPLPWLFRRGGGIASCSLLRSSVYEAVGGWEPGLEIAEDTMLFSLMAIEGPWLHVEGAPVDYFLGNAAERGEENNLSRKHPLANLKLARVYERIIQRVGERRPDFDQREIRRAVARTWRNAGKELLARGRPGAARGCFSRSVYWNRLQYNAWRRLLRA